MNYANLWGRCPDCGEIPTTDNQHFWLWHHYSDHELVCEKVSHAAH